MIPPKGWAGTKGAQLVSLSLHLSEKNRLCLPGPSPPSCTPAPAPRQFLPSGSQLVGCFPSSPPSYAPWGQATKRACLAFPAWRGHGVMNLGAVLSP